MHGSITTRQRFGIGLRAILWFLLALLAFLGFVAIGQASLWIIAALVVLGILLQQQNPAWKVESVKWTRTLAAPKHLTGKL
jgi:hypothetical protein